jgi:hypothetical protein
MALTERTEEDKIEILSDGTMQIRTATVIERDGVEVSRSYSRHVIQPDQDTAAQSALVNRVTAALWTDELKQRFTGDKAAREASRI